MCRHRWRPRLASSWGKRGHGEEKRFQGEGVVVETEERSADADEVEGGATDTGGRSGGRRSIDLLGKKRGRRSEEEEES